MTLNLHLLYFVWTEEYYQNSPNRNKSRNLWHVTCILVCCIFDEGDAYISYILDVLFSFFQQVLAYFISGTFHNSWSAVERKFFSYSSLPIYLTEFNFIFHFCTLKKMEKWNSWQNLYFDAKPKNFLSLNGYWISNILLTSLGVFLLNSELQLLTAGLCTYCDFVPFFPMSSKTHSTVFVRNFLLLCYFWMITWLLMTFVDLFLLFLFLSLDLIFFVITFCSNLPLSIVFAINSISQAGPFWGLFFNVFAYLQLFFLHKSSQTI